MLDRRGFLSSALGSVAGLGLPCLPLPLPACEELQLLSPERVVIMGANAQISFRSRRHSNLVDTLKKDVATRFRGPDYALYPDEKFRLIVCLMERLTTYYHVPGYLRQWSTTLALREALGTTAIGGQFGLLHQFQAHGSVQTESAGGDWWLFLFPQGVDWASLDNQPVHAMLGVVYPTPWIKMHKQALQDTWTACQTAEALHRKPTWFEISQLDRVSAARLLNPHLAAAARVVNQRVAAARAAVKS